MTYKEVTEVVLVEKIRDEFFCPIPLALGKKKKCTLRTGCQLPFLERTQIASFRGILGGGENRTRKKHTPQSLYEGLKKKCYVNCCRRSKWAFEGQGAPQMLCPYTGPKVAMVPFL